MSKVGSKRKLSSHDALGHQDNSSQNHLASPVKRDLLERYYPIVRTLRQHVLSKLPHTSRIRRKKVATLGLKPDCTSLESRLANVLDTTLVCTTESTSTLENEETRWQKWLRFSLKGDESYVTISDGVPSSIASQSEIVDFVIWLLFSREQSQGARPRHLMCDGFRRGAQAEPERRTFIPGIISINPNFHVKALKEEPWPHVLALLGQSGERVMINLLVDCSLFVKIDAGTQNYFQHTGVPLFDLHAQNAGHLLNEASSNNARKSSEITLVRSRTFYAKPALTARGLIRFGYKHIHALNRFPYTRQPVGAKLEPGSETLQELEKQNDGNKVQLLMYIFPRQFGLHNVFTSEVNTKQTVQKFQDYTLRDNEILQAMRPGKGESAEKRLPKVPKRLRGRVEDLVQRLQILHERCSYVELLKHYCPTIIDNTSKQKKANSCRQSTFGPKGGIEDSTALASTQQYQTLIKRNIRKRYANTQSARSIKYDSLIELASPYAHVSAFCQAVLSKIIPDMFWGDDGMKSHNKTVFLHKVDYFIQLRRFEGISLHDIAQDFKITDISWLQPPYCQGHKASKTDMNKRYEIFHEFLYYVFDSLLIPLIRSHFYVTESNNHRFQIFYFRHDVWKIVADSAMSDLKAGMFEELKLDEAKQILDSRRLGFSQIRLLPKGSKMRPITNLKRRYLSNVKDTKVLGPSINSVLLPIHTMLRHERDMNPSKLGSTLFAVGDIYERLKSFKQTLGSSHHVFYFVKLDVTAAFDTIPQSAVVKLMRSIPRQKQYPVSKHVEMRVGERLSLESGSAAAKPTKRWRATAIEEGESASFLDRLEGRIGKHTKNTVFIDNAALTLQDSKTLLNLLAQHVGQNIVKIGKKYYRQKKGIPQGSVLSSFMCNYFYADLESRHLDFLKTPDCLLMRLIDDFLLITLDKSKAIKFVEIMHRGLPEYGVEVNPAKTLVNFGIKIGEDEVRRLPMGSKFLYCGTLINCQTLEISKNHERDKNISISSSLTIEYSRSPGQNFQRKILQAFKIQSHLMFFDTAHNSTETIVQALRGAFSETATKMWAYIRCLPSARRPSQNLVLRTIAKVADIAFLILTSKSRKIRYEHYTCDVRKAEITMAAYSSFLDILSRRQTRFDVVIAWLREEIARLSIAKQETHCIL